MTLREYVLQHTDRARGECRCGACYDQGDKPDPTRHAVDVFFFLVAVVNDPTEAAFRELTTAHSGEFATVDPFDGLEHNYIELGAWLGDQGMALQYMGLGAALGVFTLATPKLRLVTVQATAKVGAHA